MDAPYILIAEGNKNHSFLMNTLLKEIRSNINWAFFTNGEELLKIVKENEVKPCLVITEISIAKKGGIGILKEIKNDIALNEIPVVILTSSSCSIDIGLAFENNCDGYYLKGDDLLDFKDALNDMLVLMNLNELSIN